MNGKTHVFYGIGFVFLIYAMLVYISWTTGLFDRPDLLIMVVGGTFGALFPDFDRFFGWENHRDTISHSSLLPLLATISFIFSPNMTSSWLLFFVNLGIGTHLIYDMFLSDIPDKYNESIFGRWGYRLVYFVDGKVGGTFKGYNHKYANQHKRKWLLTNGILCLILAGILFIKIFYQIDLDGWWL